MVKIELELKSAESIDIASGLIDRTVDIWESIEDNKNIALKRSIIDLQQIAEHIQTFCKATEKNLKLDLDICKTPENTSDIF